MKRMLLLGLPVLSISALADTAQDVRCREIGFSQAAEARDAERFASFIDADARFVGGSVARGVDAVVAAWAPFFEENGPDIKWRPQFVEVLDEGRLALTRGPYRLLAVAEDGTPVEGWGTFNSVWRLNADGQWRVVFDAGGPLPDPPSADDRVLLDQPDDCDTG